MRNIKKYICLLICVIMTWSLTACSKNEASEIPPVEQDKDISANIDSKTLVVYFSMPDNVDNSSVDINGEILGNTQYIGNTSAPNFLSANSEVL